jgi:hypothetical protein
MKRCFAALLLAAALAGLAGCANRAREPAAGSPGAYALVGGPMNGYALQSAAYAGPVTNGRVLFLDPAVAATVADDGDRATILPDGRLRAEADLRNRTGYRLQVQIQCVFQDAQGRTYGDETEWRTLTLTENASETVPFDSMNSSAHDYTIRIRQIR